MSSKISLLKRIGLGVSLLLFIFSFSFGNVHALTAAQAQVMQEGIDYFDTQVNSCGTGSGTGAALTGNDNVQKAYNYFIQKGLTPDQAAGLVGNLMGESGVNPDNSQDKKMDPTPIPNVGFGIGQWTTAGRQQGLVTLAQQEGVSPTDLGVQLDYTWQELNTDYSGALKDLKATSNVGDATAVIMNEYEEPKERVQNLIIRTNDANQVLAQYGNGAANVGTNSSTPSTCTTAAVQCTSTGGAATTGTTSIGANVVCIAQQELATWEAQPGYPKPAYSENGYYKYSVNNPEEWCADFVSWVYNQAGYPFSGGLNGGWRLPAVASIQTLGEKNGNFHYHNLTQANEPDYDPSYTPQPGDLAIHSTGGNPDYHVNIFISSSGGVSNYIGGDQGSGPYPGGSIVSTDQSKGYTGDDIIGYVSPTS